MSQTKLGSASRLLKQPAFSSRLYTNDEAWYKLYHTLQEPTLNPKPQTLNPKPKSRAML